MKNKTVAFVRFSLVRSFIFIFIFFSTFFAFRFFHRFRVQTANSKHYVVYISYFLHRVRLLAMALLYSKDTSAATHDSLVFWALCARVCVFLLFLFHLFIYLLHHSALPSPLSCWVNWLWFDSFVFATIFVIAIVPRCLYHWLPSIGCVLRPQHTTHTIASIKIVYAVCETATQWTCRSMSMFDPAKQTMALRTI